VGVVAFVTWLLTGVLGIGLVVIWIANGGRRHAERPPSRLPAAVLFGHVLLATVGLVVWMVYLVTRSDRLAWLAFAVVAAVVSLGLVMFFRWLPQPRVRPVDAGAPITPGRIGPASRQAVDADQRTATGGNGAVDTAASGSSRSGSASEGNLPTKATAEADLPSGAVVLHGLFALTTLLLVLLVALGV
jgi:hypothetical protein